MLTQGTTAPGFLLTGIDPTETRSDDTLPIREFSLETLLEAGSVLFAFYPGDFSPVCTEELCSLRDKRVAPAGSAGRYVAISRDSLFTHEAFAYEHDLEFPLLSDVQGEVCRAFDALHEDPVQGRGVEAGLPKRTLYVVAPDRTITYAWQSDDPYVEPDLEAAIEELAA